MLNDTSTNFRQYLNNFIFNNAWNSHRAEFRNNIVAKILGNGVQLNSVAIKGGVVQLPDTNPYYVFAVAQAALCGLQVKSNKWIKLSEWMRNTKNTNTLDLRITDKYSKWLYRDMIYVATHPLENAFLIAVNANMVRDICSEELTELYVSVYYDKNTPGSAISEFYYIDSTDKRYTVNEIINNQTYTTLIVNGMEMFKPSRDYRLNILIGDYVEIIKDSDVVLDCIINLSTEDGARYYHSTKDNKDKYILHIPKKLNINEYVLTHNTCDFYIRNVSSKSKLRGLFLNRFDTRYDLGQLTHQDYWISRTLVEQYCGPNYLNSDNVQIRIIARRHGFEQKLLNDGNYVRQLYHLNDEDICTVLEGGGPSSLSFWTANNLEHSKYNAMMFGHYFEQTTKLYDQIDALGYNNILATLTDRVSRFIVNTADVSDFEIKVPYCMQKSNNFFAYVYLNGNKLHDDDINISSRTDKNTVIVSIDTDDVSIAAGDLIIVEIYEKHDTRGQYIIVDEQHNVLNTGKFTDLLVYQVNEAVEDPLDKNVFSDMYQVDNTFTPVNINDIATVAIDGNNDNIITFKNSVYGNRYLITTAEAFIKLDDIVFNENEMMCGFFSTGPIMLSLMNFAGDIEIDRIPYLWKSTPIVFFNNRELAIDIDYSFNTVYSLAGNLAYTSIHLNNCEYVQVPSITNGAKTAYTVSYTANSWRYRFIDNPNIRNNKYLVIDYGWLESAIGTYDIRNRVQELIDMNIDELVSTYGGVVIMAKDYISTPFVSNRRKEFIQVVDNHITNFDVMSNPIKTLSTYLTSDDLYGYGHDFVKTIEMYDDTFKGISNTDIITYYQPNSVMLTAHGKAITDITVYQGLVKINEPVMIGDLFAYRSSIPDWLVNLINDIDPDIEELRLRDLTRQAIIMSFLREYFSAFVNDSNTNHNHQLTSTVLALISKDIYNDIFNPPYDVDPSKMIAYAEDYVKIRSQDAVLSGALNDIELINSGVVYINTTYHLTYSGLTKNQRIWKNVPRRVEIRWINGQWIIRSYDSSERVYWYADDSTGLLDPWSTELNWQPGSHGTGNIPVLLKGSLDLNYVDINPSYAPLDSSISTNKRLIIERYRDILVPEDTNIRK